MSYNFLFGNRILPLTFDTFPWLVGISYKPPKLSPTGQYFFSILERANGFRYPCIYYIILRKVAQPCMAEISGSETELLAIHLLLKSGNRIGWEIDRKLPWIEG